MNPVSVNADDVIWNSKTVQDIPKWPKCYKIIWHFIKKCFNRSICKPTMGKTDQICKETPKNKFRGFSGYKTLVDDVIWNAKSEQRTSKRSKCYKIV